MNQNNKKIYKFAKFGIAAGVVGIAAIITAPWVLQVVVPPSAWARSYFITKLFAAFLLLCWPVLMMIFYAKLARTLAQRFIFWLGSGSWMLVFLIILTIVLGEIYQEFGPRNSLTSGGGWGLFFLLLITGETLGVLSAILMAICDFKLSKITGNKAFKSAGILKIVAYFLQLLPPALVFVTQDLSLFVLGLVICASFWLSALILKFSALKTVLNKP